MPENRDAARRKQQEVAPLLLIASPICAAFSALQHWNHKEMKPRELIHKVRAAMEHLGFALELSENQAEAGWLFLSEYPVQAMELGAGQKDVQI